MKDFTNPPKWVLFAGVAMLVVAAWTWAPGGGPAVTTPVANFAHAERIDFTDALKKVRNEPASLEKLVFVKGLRAFPDKVIVDYKNSNSDVVADIPGEFDYNIIAAEADRQNVAKQSLPMSGKDARQEYVMGPTEEGGSSNLTRLLSTLLMLAPLILMGAMVFFMWKNSQMGGGGAGAFAKSKHKKFEPDKGPKVTFADVAGVDEAKEDCMMIVDFLKDPAELKELGGKLAKGVLLVGSPGCGKTLLAKAIAGEANVPFFYVNAPEFVEMFVGVGAARVRDLFEEIKKHLPCILAIDELDAVGQHRGTGIGGGNDERQQTITQLLAELDGFEGTEGLVAFAMTNRPDVLDPALTRGGRFGKRIIVPKPDKQGRFEIINVHARGVKLDPAIDFMELAGAMSGFSGADIADVLKVYGPMYSIKRHRKLWNKKATVITRDDLDQGISQIQMGGSATEGRSKRLSADVKKLLSYHELGHALVAEFLFRMRQGWSGLWGDQVRKVTIIGAGGAGGYTAMWGDEDPFCQTKEQLLGMITSLLAATRAEQMFLGTRSTGAQNDIERAYEIAKHMVTQLGMSSLGPISVGKSGGNPFLGMTMAQSGGYGLGPESSNQIDHEIFLILADCALRAERILAPLSGLMHHMAPILTENETMLREQFVQVWDGYMEEHSMPEVSMDILTETELARQLPRLGLRVPRSLAASVEAA